MRGKKAETAKTKKAAPQAKAETGGTKKAASQAEEVQTKERVSRAEADYRRRFDRHLDELRWLYMELYDNGSMFA